MRFIFIRIFAYVMLISSIYKFFLAMLSSPVASIRFFLNIFFDICWFLASIAILKRQIWARKFVIFLCSIFPFLFGLFVIIYLFINRVALTEILMNKNYILALVISFLGLLLFIPKETAR